MVVPSLNRDPVQSLRPWPVVVTFQGQDLTIPALPATDWLAILLTGDLQPDDIFPGLLSPKDVAFVEDQLFEGHLGQGEFQDLIIGIIENVSARRWWIALRLIEVARVSWDSIGAEMLLRGVDTDRISLSAWLDVLLLTIMRNMDSKDTTMFTMRLEAPPVTAEVAEEEMEMPASSFMALAAQ